MTDKTKATTDSGQPINITISQPDLAAEGAANMTKAQEILAKADEDYAQYDIGGKKMTAAEYDEQVRKAVEGR